MFIANLMLSALISNLSFVRSGGELLGVDLYHIPKEDLAQKEQKKCDALKLKICPALDSLPACGILSVSASVPHYGNFIGDWTLLLDSVRVPVQFRSVAYSGGRSAVGVKFVPLAVCPSSVRVVDLSGRYVDFKR